MLNAREEFPNLYVDIEDMRWAKFRVEQGHGKVYLPEQLLLMEAEYLQQKNMKQKAEHERKVKERKSEHDSGISKPEENLVSGVRSSSPPGKRVDLSAFSAEELKEQRAQLEKFEQEKKRRQANAIGSIKVPYTVTPAGKYGAPDGGAGMPHDGMSHPSAVGRAGNGSVWHPHSGHQPGYPEHSSDHQHRNAHARHEQLAPYCCIVDHDKRHLSPQNPIDHNYNSKSGDGRGHLHAYHRQELNSRQHQPAGTNQPPPGSPNLAINPSYGEIPPGSSAAPYHAKNTSDDHQHKKHPYPSPRHIPIMNRHQQPEEQLPSWPTMDTVVVVRNAVLQNPVTGTVRFIGRIQGFDDFVVGLLLVSCMCALLSIYSLFAFVQCTL